MVVDLRRGMRSTTPNQKWQIQAVTFIFCIYHNISSSKIQDKGEEHFESLDIYITAGFDPNSDTAASVSKNYHDGGILAMDNKDINRIK